MSSKQIYTAFSGNHKLLCSRCFGSLGEISKYGCDDQGYWFIAPCKQCGAKIKWYRDNDGQPLVEAAPESEENAFSFALEGDEIVMKAE